MKPSVSLRKLYPLWLVVGLAVLVGVLFVGWLFWTHFNQAFIPEHSAWFEAMRLWWFVSTLPVFALGDYMLRRRGREFFSQFPKRREGIVSRMLVPLLMSLAFIFAPEGWLAMLGWSFGLPVKALEARIEEVFPFSEGRRNCDQFARIAYRQDSAKICLEHRVEGNARLQAGDQVRIDGRISMFGLYVKTIHLPTT